MFVCQSCGQNYQKWMGRCQECGTWNSMIEEFDKRGTAKASYVSAPSEPPRSVTQIKAENSLRFQTHLEEFDTLLGGGLVPGSVTLIGGEPGIGKSTLLLQIAENCAKTGQSVLYVSGEESASQIALRSSRLGLGHENLWIVSETRFEQIQSYVETVSPKVLVIDSIQTTYSSSVDSQPGSVSQIRECAFQLITLSKAMSITTFLVGHVTKEGNIAGPRLLEHMVDVVLYFETATGQSFRLLRSIKNRYGSTQELGIFEMGNKGLVAVSNPSEFFLSERPKATAGSVVGVNLEGTRPLLVEIQALVSQSYLTMPRRTSMGVDPNRVSLLVAILEKRMGLRFFDQDVFVNVAGGLKITEPAVDLALVAALLSSFSGRTTEKESLFFGEVGLAGEVRSVRGAELRLREAVKLGFRTAFVPKKVADELKQGTRIKLCPVEHIGVLKDLV